MFTKERINEILEIEDYRKLAEYALQVEKALDLLLDNLFEMDDETCPADVDGENFCCDVNICGVERPYKKCWLKFYLDKAKKVIWLGFFMNLLLIIFTNIAIPLTYPEFWKGQEHFQFIFGAIPRIVLASFIGYLVGELSNSWLLELIKKITNGKWLFIRTIGSSMVGQIFDTVLFITIAFYGTMPNEVLITMVIAQYIFKVLCEALAGTPLAYGLVRWVKHENSIS